MHEGRPNCSQPFGILSQPFPVFSCVYFFLIRRTLDGYYTLSTCRRGGVRVMSELIRSCMRRRVG